MPPAPVVLSALPLALLSDGPRGCARRATLRGPLARLLARHDIRRALAKILRGEPSSPPPYWVDDWKAARFADYAEVVAGQPHATRGLRLPLHARRSTVAKIYLPSDLAAALHAFRATLRAETGASVTLSELVRIGVVWRRTYMPRPPAHVPGLVRALPRTRETISLPPGFHLEEEDLSYLLLAFPAEGTSRAWSTAREYAHFKANRRRATYAPRGLRGMKSRVTAHSSWAAEIRGRRAKIYLHSERGGFLRVVWRGPRGARMTETARLRDLEEVREALRSAPRPIPSGRIGRIKIKNAELSLIRSHGKKPAL